MLAIRYDHPALCCEELSLLEGSTTAVAAYLRNYDRKHLLFVNNLSDSTQNTEYDLPVGVHGEITDLLTCKVMGNSRKRIFAFPATVRVPLAADSLIGKTIF